MRRHDIQINAHQSGAPGLQRAFFFFSCVCENDGDPLISRNDLRLSAALLPLLFFFIHFSPPARIFDEDPQDWALIACTPSVNKGIVLETLPPSRLAATHAGTLSSISAIAFASMPLRGWPKRPRAAAPWRKQGYLLESSR